MTPAQLTALEAVAGRSLTEAEQTAIDAFLPDRNDVAIAEILSVGRVTVRPFEIGNGLILSTIGLTSGNALLDYLGTDATFRHVKPLLEQGRLDVSSVLVRGALDGFASAGLITQGEADALKSLAETPNPIHYNAVSDALNVAEGRLVL